MFAYCGNSPVNRSDHSGQFWLFDVVVGVATQYASDVVGNLISGKTGADIFTPTSTVGEYISAGVTALIPGSGWTSAIVSNIISESITWVENVVTGNAHENDIMQSIVNVAVNSAVDVGFEAVSEFVTTKIDAAGPNNYSSYAHSARKSNPSISKDKIYNRMKLDGTLKRSVNTIIDGSLQIAQGVFF